MTSLLRWIGGSSSVLPGMWVLPTHFQTSYVIMSLNVKIMFLQVPNLWASADFCHPNLYFNMEGDVRTRSGYWKHLVMLNPDGSVANALKKVLDDPPLPSGVGKSRNYPPKYIRWLNTLGVSSMQLGVVPPKLAAAWQCRKSNKCQQTLGVKMS